MGGDGEEKVGKKVKRRERKRAGLTNEAEVKKIPAQTSAVNVSTGKNDRLISDMLLQCHRIRNDLHTTLDSKSTAV